MTGPLPAQIADTDIHPWASTHVRTLTAAWLMRQGSHHSRRAYATAHRQFVGFLEDHAIHDPAAITRGHVDAWRLALEDAGAAPATISSRLAAISSWCDVLVDARLLSENPAARVVRPPKPDTGTTPCPATPDLLAALDWIEAHEGNDTAIAVLLCARYALRVGEVAGLRTRDVTVDSSGVTVLTVRIKGGRTATVRVGGDLGARVASLAHGRVGRLLRSVAGPINVRGIARALERASAMLKIPHLSPHQLRVHAITAALDAGHHPNDVARFARHRNVASTLRYDRNPDRNADAIADTIAAIIR